MRRVTATTTGGTLEKVYDEPSGGRVNRASQVRRMLAELRLEDTEISVLELMSKDSLDMSDADRRRILEAARVAGAEDATAGADGIVILHGTDTLAETGDLLHRELAKLEVAVVLTGAMRPFEMKRSDARQNLTEALFATGALPPAVYVVAHGRALRFRECGRTTLSWYSGSTRWSSSSIDSTTDGRMPSQAWRISAVLSTLVGLPSTGTVTSTGAPGSPTKLDASFQDRTMSIEKLAWARAGRHPESHPPPSGPSSDGGDDRSTPVDPAAIAAYLATLE